MPLLLRHAEVLACFTDDIKEGLQAFVLVMVAVPSSPLCSDIFSESVKKNTAYTQRPDLWIFKYLYKYKMIGSDNYSWLIKEILF